MIKSININVMKREIIWNNDNNDQLDDFSDKYTKLYRSLFGPMIFCKETTFFSVEISREFDIRIHIIQILIKTFWILRDICKEFMIHNDILGYIFFNIV